MTKKHTDKTASMKFEDFPTEIPALGEAKVQSPDREIFHGGPE